MPPRRKTLTETDRAAWAEYARHVRSLPGRELPARPTEPPPVSLPRTTPNVHAPDVNPPGPGARAMAKTPSLVTGLQPPGLDRASWGRFRTGKLPAVRTLDLHGKTAQAAFHALERFLVAAHADQIRCVEVITGRGTGEQGGVIRRELPHWLNLPRLRPLVLAATHPHALNQGSVRLLLRRSRTPAS